MDQEKITFRMSLAELELIDALVVAAIEKLDERERQMRSMSLLDRTAEGEWINRLMRERYVEIGRRLNETRERVPA